MIVLGLGSNIGDREDNLRCAIEKLQERQIAVRRISSIYETEPVGKTDQPDFLNLVMEIETQLAPEQLLAVCLSVEAIMGRRRKERWGPRNIDIDILIYDNIRVHSDNLILPHPRLAERRFVLVPLTEIAGDKPIAGGRTARELLASTADVNLVRLFKACEIKDGE